MRVDSSAISDIRYDEGRSRLLVTFNDGDQYLYYCVPEPVSRSFVGAPSKGRFFAQEIRGKYRFDRIYSG